ncbi:hypothetical protein FCM35_KLT18544 [Carex littledalei]|uniref:Uncharacterized protein n=1 Tax=Carex littledalei TaxID=544730 RepID=A0A833RFC4_9POAL|nr:hypothetical protein FCM35_KLT18544 [Carex littledalei]
MRRRILVEQGWPNAHWTKLDQTWYDGHPYPSIHQVLDTLIYMELSLTKSAIFCFQPIHYLNTSIPFLLSSTKVSLFKILSSRNSPKPSLFLSLCCVLTCNNAVPA